MYLVVVYDIRERRVARVLKLLRRYLHWVQNSVFEGEITEGKKKEMTAALKKIIKEEEDSVLIYSFSSENAFVKTVLGVEKGAPEHFI